MKSKDNIRDTLIHLIKTYNKGLSNTLTPEQFIDTYYSDFREWLLK